MKTCHFQRKNTNFLDSNTATGQNERVEQGVPPLRAASGARVNANVQRPEISEITVK
jgi:hypothetical protein